ncbi:MAG: malate/lactate/ureidoglycolate dehydrogenase, partial [Betaproteobacteria bacterium]|nr:malate/lactate/ureidoglycolate dehydrogenase [Betaproteobacteria bacterium]
MAHIFQADDLERKVASLFAAAGSLPAEAQQVAANLVLANL